MKKLNERLDHIGSLIIVLNTYTKNMKATWGLSVEKDGLKTLFKSLSAKTPAEDRSMRKNVRELMTEYQTYFSMVVAKNMWGQDVKLRRGNAKCTEESTSVLWTQVKTVADAVMAREFDEKTSDHIRRYYNLAQEAWGEVQAINFENIVPKW